MKQPFSKSNLYKGLYKKNYYGNLICNGLAQNTFESYQ